MNLVLVLLKSKRFWVIAVTTALHFLAKYHVVLSNADVSDLADQLVLIAGSVAVIGTKIADHRQANASPSQPQP
jgi:hypothetical protein